METPIKSTRRRLKKVLKKSRTSLCVNANSIYHKKLKSAINVSLNSTLTVRTLQTNNRSLASSLEKMRQDFRQVHEHYARLLEENHSLREKILELQRIDASEKYIEDEVSRRFEDRMKDVEKKLDSLYGYTRGFLDTLSELSDVCVNNPSSTVDDLSSTESSNHNYTLLSNLKPFPSDLSHNLDDTSDFESAQSDCMPEAGMEKVDVDNPTNTKNNMHEMTLIMEQSMLCTSSESSSNINSKLDTVSESTLSTSLVADKQVTVTKLPMRVPKCPRRARTTFGKLTSSKCTESPKTIMRRETVIIATNEPSDGALLTDIAMPKFLVSDCHDENEPLGVENQDPVPTFTSPAKRRQSSEKNVKRRTNRLSQISPKQLHPTTLHHGADKSPMKKLSPKNQLPSPVRIKYTRKSHSEGARSQPRPGTSPKKISTQVTPHNEKQETSKECPINHKPATYAKRKKHPLSPKLNKTSPKLLLRHEDKQKQQNLFISNEFSLLNAHKQRAETTDKKPNYASIILHCEPQEMGEHTIFPIDDMELTRMEEDILKAQIKHVSPIDDCNERNSEEFEYHLPIARSRSKPKQTGQTVIEADDAVEEKVPEVVTMRFPKPGQLTFAASRKESDGTRKNVPVAIPRARSKSKKQLADMIEKLPETKPQSIFDFHEKTPGFLCSEKQASSLNISADKSSLSQMVPLNRNRSQRRMSNSPSSGLSSKSASHLEYININKKTIHSFYDGQTFEEPVKEGSPPSKSIYKTRSRSRGRKLYDSESENMEVRTRSQSRKRSTHSQEESLVNVMMSASSETPYELLCSTNVNQCNEQGSSTELTSINSTSEDFIKSHLDSDAFSGQAEGSSEALEKEMQEKASENILAPKSISNSQYPAMLGQMRRNASGINRKRKGDEDLNISVSVDVPSVLETNDKTTEKECTILHQLESDNLESINKIIKVGDLKRPASSVASSSKSQDTNNFVSEFDEALMSCVESRTDIQESKSLGIVSTETFSSDNLRRKKARSKPTEKKISEISSASSSIENELESVLSEPADFICTRKNRTKGKKGVESSGESAVSGNSKSLQIFQDDLVADGDGAVRTKLTQEKDVCDGTGTDLLLEKLRHLKTPALSYSEERIHSENTVPSCDKDETLQKTSHGPRTSKILKTSSDRPASATKRVAPESSPDSLTTLDGKRRRAAAKVNYAEVRLNLKLRRGDPHTSHYCTGDKIEIFKSPKSKAKKKIIHRSILGNLQNLSIREEQGLSEK